MNGHDPEHAFDIESSSDDDIDDEDISDEDTDDEDEDDEDYDNDEDEDEDEYYESDDAFAIDLTEFTRAGAVDELRDISHMTLDAKLESLPSKVEERAKGSPARQPEQGQSRLMAAIGNDPALFDRYRFVKGANTGANSSQGKGKSVVRGPDTPMSRDAQSGTEKSPLFWIEMEFVSGPNRTLFVFRTSSATKNRCDGASGRTRWYVPGNQGMLAAQ